jgi:hypothetical protein
MDDQYKISKPDQGVHTLVSELSILRLDKTIKKLKEMRSKGLSEKEILAFIDSQHEDFDQRSRTQIYRLSLGLVPKEDFTEAELESWKALDDTTIQIQFQEPREGFQECSLVFFEKQRWVVVSREEKTLVLKRF